MKRIKDFKVGDEVEFIFLGERKSGVVLRVFDKENKLSVKGVNGITYQPKTSEKESQFCYLI
jgi:ribosomal protein L24